MSRHRTYPLLAPVAIALFALVVGWSTPTLAASGAELSLTEGPPLDPAVLEQHLEDLGRFFETRLDPLGRWATASRLPDAELERQRVRLLSHLRRVEAQVEGADSATAAELIDELRALRERLAQLNWGTEPPSADPSVGSPAHKNLNWGTEPPSADPSVGSPANKNLNWGTEPPSADPSVGSPAHKNLNWGTEPPSADPSVGSPANKNLNWGTEPPSADNPFTSTPLPVTPGNDDCVNATPIGIGSVSGDNSSASNDGEASCDVPLPGDHLDVWYRYTAPESGRVAAAFDGSFGSTMSVHTACPGPTANELACGPEVEFDAVAGSDYLIRISGPTAGLGQSFTFDIGPATSISGRVTDQVSGAPIAGASVIFWDDQFFSTGVTTDGDGRYTLRLFRSGTFFAFVRTPEHRDEIYDDIPCPEFCDPTIGTPIEIQPGDRVEGIDFRLNRLGSISGTITDANTGAPIASAGVAARDEDGILAGFGFADASGHYRVEGLDAGTYFAIAMDSAYLDELYDDLPCPDPDFGDCVPALGDPITVELDADRPGVDFALRRLGGLSGAVTDASTGAPIPFVDVSVFTTDGFSAGFATTDETGSYLVGGLNPGNYFVHTSSIAQFVDEVYDDMPCPRECDPFVGTPVAVAVEQVTPGIDFALDPGGRLSGTVTDSTGAPIAQVDVIVWDPDGSFVVGGVTDDMGAYEVGGLATGSYRVGATFPGSPGYIAELYDDMPCLDGPPLGLPACGDVGLGTPVAATVRQTTPGIDFALDRLSSISGSVTDRATGEPVTSFLIEVWDALGNQVGNGFFDTSPYRVDDLLPGTYFVTVSPAAYLGELYDDLPCAEVFNGCDPTTGTPVVVELSADTPGIDFALDPLGSISGTVISAATGEPLAGVGIEVLSTDSLVTRFSSTDEDGRYTVSGLPTGDFYAITRSLEFLDEVYDDVPCTFGVCDPTLGDPIPVTLGVDTPDIDFALARLGVIEGTVRDSFFGNPILTTVLLLGNEGILFASTQTDDAGRYVFEGVQPGSYFVSTRNFRGFRDEIYDDLPCPGGGFCDPSGGTPVPAALDSVTRGIDFVLDVEQGISGRLVHEASGAPIPGAEVFAFDDIGRPVWSGLTDPDGDYVLALHPGVYFVVTAAALTFPGIVDELYDDIPCELFSCDETQGTPILVDEGVILEDFDFALAGGLCLPSADRLCLNRGRFEVQATWKDFQGTAGDGMAQSLTGDSGYFWFFGPDNIELVVKVLDACVDPFNSFWVFATGLTNVQTELTVTDTWTGEVRTYDTALGEPFELIRDTSAFETCDATPAGGRTGRHPLGSLSEQELVRATRLELERILAGGGAAAKRSGGGAAIEPVPIVAPAIVAPAIVAPPIVAPVVCTPSSINLCLQNGRFFVTSSWRAADGTEGLGQAVGLTGDTGYFWFFDDANVEAVVKVLDACNLDPFNSFWVFAAGLTDVEVRVTVTDTANGEVREYFNPLGAPFQPVQDTDAFQTCP